MAKPNIVNSEDVRRTTRKAPATRLIESLPEGMLVSRQVAEHFGVNIETVRRLARATKDDGSPRFKAPSKAVKSGELIIWVYTPADMKELAAYFGQKPPTQSKRGRKG